MSTSPGWNEGGSVNICNKGLVTQNRLTRKDAFYFYKANWTEQPVVYICSRRMASRKEQTTDLRAYTNCESATLYVNGKRVSTVKPDEICVCTFPNVTLAKGDNVITVVGKQGNMTVRDTCTQRVE